VLLRVKTDGNSKTKWTDGQHRRV